MWLQVGDVENPQGAQIHQPGQGDGRAPKDKGEQAFRELSQCIFTGRRKESKQIKIAEKKLLEDSMSQEPDAGGNVEMCRHVLPKPTWNAGCIKISSWTTIKHIKV
jgi:uncharacterized protein with von Willebrand factor type A (vWA) domain